MVTGVQPTDMNSDLTARLLDKVQQKASTIKRVLAEHGECSLDEYMQQLACSEYSSYQPASDVGDMLVEYVKPLLGDEIAQAARDELMALPLVLTANHHGVDFFAQSVQGTLLLSQRKIKSGNKTRKARTVPVFACGSIAMNNLTYPRGALFYTGTDEQLPLRLPIFPDRVKRQLVSRTAPFDQGMVDRAVARVDKLAAEGRISAELQGSMRTILTEHYSADEVLAQSSYSDQAVLLNSRIWREMMPRESDSELIYLELEQIALRLLQKDLSNKQSLIHILLFEQTVRAELMKLLNGAKGCWSGADLSKQAFEEKLSSGSGTFMFWGVDERGRRLSLGVDRINGVEVLRPVDSSAASWQIPLTPESIAEGLQQGRLLPSLFSCYTVISLARGVVCAGGYYQAEYLPVMQQGVVAALNSGKRYSDVASIVQRVVTSCYLSGMQMVMAADGQSGLVPAGPIEIIAGGGLSGAELKQLSLLSVRQAHIASLSETIADVAPDQTLSVSLFAELARETAVLQGAALIVK